MVAGFMGLVLAGNLAVLILAQIVFGLALGLIYYSSLFYSMDVGDTKGEHGGLHEGTIGVGIFAGPAIAVAALHFLPDVPNAGVMAVGIVLMIGFIVLNWLRWRWQR
jgi:MFS family permease